MTELLSIKPIDDLLELWREKQFEYIIDRTDEGIRVEKEHENWKKKQKQAYERIGKWWNDSNRLAHQHWKETVDSYWNNNRFEYELKRKGYPYHRDAMEWLNHWLDREVEKRKLRLILQVVKKAGKIVDARGLRFGYDTGINGTIVGEKTTVDVETIMAGGYNIQCFHYRVLIKPWKQHQIDRVNNYLRGR